MKNNIVKRILKKRNRFTSDYNKMVQSNLLHVSIKTEWVKNGDIFDKFTMYDTNYRIIPNIDSIGSTTLINKL